MRMGQGLGHGGITCVLQTQFSRFFFFRFFFFCLFFVIQPYNPTKVCSSTVG